MPASLCSFADVGAHHAVEEEVDGVEKKIEGDSCIDQVAHDLAGVEQAIIEDEEGELGEEHGGPIESTDGIEDLEACSTIMVLKYATGCSMRLVTSRRGLVTLESGKFHVWTE